MNRTENQNGQYMVNYKQTLSDGRLRDNSVSVRASSEEEAIKKIHKLDSHPVSCATAKYIGSW